MLLKRYSSAFGLSSEEQAVLYKRYDQLTSESPTQSSLIIEKDKLREEDAGLLVGKRSASAAPYPVPWQRESMKVPPVVRVKQTWDPKQRQQEMQQQGKVENGRSRAVEGLVTGEENFPHPWQKLMRVEVKSNPEEELGFVGQQQREEGEYEGGEYREDKYKEIDEEEDEYTEDKYKEIDEEEESDEAEDEYDEEVDEELDYYVFLKHMEDLAEFLSRVQ